MRKKLMAYGPITAILWAVVAGAQEAGPSAAAAPSSSGKAWQATEEQAIRTVIQAFGKAYDAHDAKAVAALFTEDAEAVSEDGQAVQGRQSIAQTFGQVFAEHPKTRIEISVRSIRFVSPTAAIEDGSTRVVNAADEPPERSRYTVIHVKRHGKWQMVSARDLPDEPSTAEEQLAQLTWLIGDWVDESPQSLITSSYRWAANRHFILREFTIQIAGHAVVTGVQRIGWDPMAKKLRCWVFDSEGGFGEGTWTREGNQWIGKWTGVTQEGQPTSSTNITTRIGKDRMTWQSRDRIVGGELRPDIDPVTIVRKPPPPRSN